VMGFVLTRLGCALPLLQSGSHTRVQKTNDPVLDHPRPPLFAGRLMDRPKFIHTKVEIWTIRIFVTSVLIPLA
jgi:hypothetical protein